MRGRVVRLVAVVGALALAAAACGSSGTSSSEGASKAPACPVDALATAKKPVDITFWHVMTSANEEELQRLTARFNASQSDVRVHLVNQQTYPELLTKYKAGLSSGDLPDVGQFEETTVQTLIDSNSTVPMQSCVDASHYDLSDFLPRAIAYYTVQGQLRSMPWNVSNPVLFYSKTAFEQAGLDPNQPPATLAQVKADSEKIMATGAAKHGMALRTQDYYVEFWYAKAGQSYVDHGGGRTARATKATLDNPTGLALFTWWKDMVSSGLAIDSGSQPGGIDHLLALGNGNAAMTIEASSALGPALAVLRSGQFPGLQIGIAPLPGVEKPTGGVPVGDGSLWISKHSTPAKQAAAWKFVQYLVAPAQLRDLHIHTGYVPIRQSVAQDPQIQAFWKQQPEFEVSYQQLLAPGGEAANGSVIGNYQGVRDAVRDAITALLHQGLTPQQALVRAQKGADTAIAEYNARVGA